MTWGILGCSFCDPAEEKSCFWVALLEVTELLERRVQPTSVLMLQALSTDVCACVAGNFKDYDEDDEEESCFWDALLELTGLLERRMQPTSVLMLQAL